MLADHARRPRLDREGARLVEERRDDTKSIRRRDDTDGGRLGLPMGPADPDGHLAGLSLLRSGADGHGKRRSRQDGARGEERIPGASLVGGKDRPLSANGVFSGAPDGAPETDRARGLRRRASIRRHGRLGSIPARHSAGGIPAPSPPLDLAVAPRQGGPRRFLDLQLHQLHPNHPLPEILV